MTSKARTDGVLVRRNELSMGGRAEVTSVGIKINVRQPDPQGRAERGGIAEAMEKLKV